MGDYSNNYSEINYKPFYIGKGDYNAKNNRKRHLTHYIDALKDNRSNKINPHKTNTIKKLIELDFKPNFKVIFETDNEDEAFKVEKELISYYGRVTDGGLLTNIAIGGTGGDTFTNNPKKEEIREKHSKNTKGSKNPMYGRGISNHPSHIAKLNKKHWNKGIKRGKSTKMKMSESQSKRPKKEIVIIDPKTLEELDVLTINDLILKYQTLNKGSVYRCIKHGGSHRGFLFKYLGEELVLTKSRREDYIKPVDNSPKGYRTTKDGHIIKVSKTVFHKDSIDSDVELKFKDVNEASQNTGFNPTVIRRKCKINNSYDKIFRWEGEEYSFNVKLGNNRKPVIRTDKNGEQLEFDSLKSAADFMGGKITSVLAVCKGRNKTYKGYKFEYKKMIKK